MRSVRRLSALIAVCVAVLAVVPLTSAPSRSVVGGQPAPTGAHQFMASIQSEDGFAYCGGSVIAPRWVLTAGHCATSDPSEVFVVTGRQNLSETDVGQRLAVDAIFVHPNFDDQLRYDAALLLLAEPTVSPAITLAGESDDVFEAPGTPVTVTGWGDQLPTYVGLATSDELREVELEVITDDECGETYREPITQDFDPDTGVCAAALLKDSCQGDSGGPLFADRSGQPVQIGIVSWGQGCAFPKFPGVYSEINNPDIRDWITTISQV